MNLTRGRIFFNSLRAVAGLMLFALGVHLVIRANIGVSPWDVFCIGLSDTFGILYGTASIAISVTLIVIDLLIGEKIGLGTILDAVVVGKTVDLLNWLDIVPVSENIWMSLVMMGVGFFIEGYSQYLYMRTGLCCGPRDSLQIGLGRRMPKIPIGVVNIMILASVLLIGWRLNGPIGVGTLLAPVGIGLMQQFSFNLMKFDPKTVVHQDIISTLRTVFSKKTDETTRSDTSNARL